MLQVYSDEVTFDFSSRYTDNYISRDVLYVLYTSLVLVRSKFNLECVFFYFLFNMYIYLGILKYTDKHA